VRDDGDKGVLMIADLQGPIVALPISAYLGCLAFTIWAAIDANSKPAVAYPSGGLSKSTLTACIVVFTLLGLVGGFAFAIYYVTWVRPKVLAFVGAHPNVTSDPFETSRKFNQALSKRTASTTKISVLATLTYGVGAYLLFGIVGLGMDLRILIPTFTAVLVFCLVSEYLQPTPPVFKVPTPPVTLRQVWTNRTTVKGNGRIYFLWSWGVMLTFYSVYFVATSLAHWSLYGTTSHIWLNAAFQFGVYIVAFSIACRKCARLK
jgi:hypothetical protein